jgi:hypothetical protein
VCASATAEEAPHFIADPLDPLDALMFVPPLKSIKFLVTERQLPPITSLTFRIDSSIKVGCDQGTSQVLSLSAGFP